jgi:pimeloyl-ACP methyl ester carboxylesterase
MKNFRAWGKAPYKVAVVHGGPGAPGYMACVARELAKDMGVLEPLQTKNSIDGQIEELAEVLKKNADLPVILVGHSWGATLSYMTTARYPALVRKLVLIGTVPLEWKVVPNFTPTWLNRLSEEERVEFLSLTKLTWDEKAEDKSEPLGRLFRLITKAESFDLLPLKDEVLQYQFDTNMAIGLEMSKLFTSGKYLELGKKIVCPVAAICGDYDVRPAGEIRESFVRAHKYFKFILLEKCGHFPWLEKYAKDKFYKVLRREIF